MIMDAQFIKARLIDFLLLKNEDILLGNEIPIGINNNRIDILSVDEFITGYEIKSEFDKIDSFFVQYELYKQIFDLVYLVTTEKLYSRIRIKLKNSKCGVMTIDTLGNIKEVKRPEKFTYMNKQEIIHSLPLKYLKESTNSTFKLSHNTSEPKYNNLDITLCYELFKTHITTSLTKCNSIFKKEKSLTTHSEDVKILSPYNSTIRV
ncbi:sce7726 family protein [Seleniivibrio woodruffii]|uniref:sce7726 family protein n=1 Tax=Seleniivibrio woodruffii TaxID=1078050 RepID=UPI0024090FF7|nr:sce7726 family protein [Seleniivibrio woodruffii]